MADIIFKLTSQQAKRIIELISLEYITNGKAFYNGLYQNMESQYAEQLKKQEEKPVPVKFLIDKKSDRSVYAYFPTMAWSHKGTDKTSYSHMGQHSVCSPAYAKLCKQATKEQYSDLLRELIGQGYNNLKILNVAE